ncbi:serine protease trypsin-like protein [Phytophthora sojae]|uniref:Serine protease trypsin-like protein n=1 Tax=Phytophthora sojae (strain P6497) TaxID=1094619 RepID=G5AE48_PHYSP|nr:serine protease trypsin-like protein [Phytophthora sojae]EGZ06450.1 serine protease trypsin-like protein [Phytophthora sojae]|eukprot:XP_009538347.1 serine protease trypsin-like protein [Phytophthora sojae]
MPYRNCGRHQDNYPCLIATVDGPKKCTGVLIAPKHVLITSGCLTRNVRWTSIGAQKFNATNDGEKFKVKAMLTHPQSTTYTNDFMVLEMEKASAVTPVALAATDGSDNKAGERAQYLGWRHIQETETTSYSRGEKLQSSEVKILSNEQCATMINIDKSNLCAGGNANEDSCQGSFGSPLIVEKANQDVVVGLTSWIFDCNLSNTPSIFARVAGAREWIESATKSTCFV